MKTKGILSKYSFKIVFTLISYLFVLKVESTVTNGIFSNIFLYIFPIFYDMMYYSENCTKPVKWFYVISTFYSLFYGVFSVLGLLHIIEVKDNNVVFVNNIILSKFYIPIECILGMLGFSIAFVIIDSLISEMEEAK